MILSVCRASAGSPITSTMPQARVSCILPTILGGVSSARNRFWFGPIVSPIPAPSRLLKSLLRVNVGTTKKGLVYAYAFDDEISLGSFNNPAEVDIHPLSLGLVSPLVEGSLRHDPKSQQGLGYVLCFL